VRPIRRTSVWLPAGVGLLLSATAACSKVPTDADEVLSIEVGALPFPSVVVGDTLRDTSGVAAPLAPTAFNFQGNPVTAPSFRFRAVDRGLSVDSVRGLVFGDSVRDTPARVMVSVGNLQAFIPIIVTRRPDTVVATQARDTLLYSLTDTTKNRSAPLSVVVRHSLTATDSTVNGWLVTFSIVSPVDTAFVRLVDDRGVSSRADTTDASGTASRQIRMDVTRIRSVNDSVVVLATAKYRGAQVRGSPVRIVMELRPGT
jgi:hypothetical protein